MFSALVSDNTNKGEKRMVFDLGWPLLAHESVRFFTKIAPFLLKP